MRRKLTEKLERSEVRFKRLRNMGWGARISLLVLLAIAILAAFAPIFAPHEPTAIEVAREAPSAEHWFGADDKGRDVLSRMMYGGRYSLMVGIGSTVLALVAGAIIGSIAGVARKPISETIMRLMDIIMAFPGIALAAVFVAVFGNSLMTLIIAIGFIYTPQLTRIVRANVMAAYGEDYVSAVVVSGARAPWILIQHVIRNVAAPVLVFATIIVADAIILEASLTFIGAGLQEPIPSWGNILSDAQGGVLAGLWWQALYPGLAIMATVLCLNILSEGITDAMVAAPSGKKLDSAKPADSSEQDEENAKTIALYDEQARTLQERIAELQQVEEGRSDRFDRTSEEAPLLEVRDLSIAFPRHGDVNVVDKVSFTVRPGETMGLVGESGCGKSITCLAIMDLLPEDAVVTGEVLYNGEDLLTMDPKQRRSMLGHELAMIYQDALSSLNPAMLIRTQMKQLTKRGGTRTAEELLELVGLDPKRVLASYPHELSGGQRQRVLIAMALTRDPKLVIADEPTTALDVTVQKQVISLLNELRDKLGFAMIFVSHDLALEAEVAHSITVMYAGQVVEQAPTVELLRNPMHEYTRGLLGAVLSIESGASRLHQIPGVVPSPADFPAGDRFAPRSSHPTVGLDTRPVLTPAPGATEHVYAALPQDSATATAVKDRPSPDRDEGGAS